MSSDQVPRDSITMNPNSDKLLSGDADNMIKTCEYLNAVIHFKNNLCLPGIE